jgi:hypothetical protein
MNPVAPPALQTPVAAAKHIASDSEMPLRPFAELVLGNPNDRRLDAVPSICRQPLRTSELDFESQYRFDSFERALVGFFRERAREIPSEMLPGVVRADRMKTTVVGPVSLSAEDMPTNVSTKSKTYEAIVPAMDLHQAAQIINLEFLGRPDRPDTQDGQGIILVRYDVHYISESGEVAHRGGARVTLCLMPEDKDKMVVYLENVIES